MLDGTLVEYAQPQKSRSQGFGFDSCQSSSPAAMYAAAASTALLSSLLL